MISTSGVACDHNLDAFNNSSSVNLMSIANWSCVALDRILDANDLPDHDVGTFPNANNHSDITEQPISANLTLSPDLAGSAIVLCGSRGVVGYLFNGVKIDAGTAVSFNDSGNKPATLPDVPSVPTDEKMLRLIGGRRYDYFYSDPITNNVSFNDFDLDGSVDEVGLDSQSDDVDDTSDAFPLDASEQLNSDGDFRSRQYSNQ